jgi:hypothetical protein
MVAVAPPVFGGLIAAFGWPLAFTLCGVFPIAALPFGKRTRPSPICSKPVAQACASMG